MENASKALIIAGALLIAIVIVSALVIMFKDLSNYEKTSTKVLSEKQISDFNKSYTSFEKTLRGNELLSLINKAIDYNEKNVPEGYTPITIAFKVNKEYIFATETGLKPKIPVGNYKVKDTDDELAKFAGSMRAIEEKYKGDKYLQRLIELQDMGKETEINALLKDIDKNMQYNNKVKKEILQYSEYVEFKRKKFKYNETVFEGEQENATSKATNGRIVELHYEEI